MVRLDRSLSRLQHWIRSRPICYRLTLGTRILLAAGFIPTGLVKLLGHRFTSMSPETDIGGLFETLYLSGNYWRFLGLVQMLAGVLLLWSRTATLGAVLFFGIITNIFVITISYDFNYTPVVTGLMLLATVYLLLWDYHRIRSLFGFDKAADMPPVAQLSGILERAVYFIGAIAGLGFFTGLRGLFVPGAWQPWLLLACVLSLITAAILGLRSGRSRSKPGRSPLRDKDLDVSPRDSPVGATSETALERG